MKKTEAVSNIDVAESISLRTFNYTDIISNNNKVYSAEIVKDKNGKYWLQTFYGRVGGTISKDLRSCSDLYDAEKEAEKIIKSKLKKGYVEVDLVKSSIGSDQAKEKIKTSSISIEQAKKIGLKVDENTKSKLNSEVQKLVKVLFGSMNDFINVTLDASCAIGQLSIVQIEKGRDILSEAKKLISAGITDEKEFNKLTNLYYSNIPFSFKYNRLDPDKLRLNSNERIDSQILTLETLENVKTSENTLVQNKIDEQYNSLNTEIELIDPKDPEYIWVNALFLKTKADNHYNFNKMKIRSLFRLKRPKEEKIFLDNAEDLARRGQKREELPYLLKQIWKDRLPESKELEKLGEAANILPLFHGSRTANFGSILKSSIRIPKSAGSITSGAAYSKFGAYFGMSSKSAQYSDMYSSYYGSGNKSGSSAYCLVNSVACGIQKIADRPFPYTPEIIKPCTTVWAKGSATNKGYSSGVINDEFITFYEKNHLLKYLIEFGE